MASSRKDLSEKTSLALRTLAPGGVSGGFAWWLVTTVPSEWAGLAAACATLFSTFLTVITPYVEKKAVEKIKRWWFLRQIQKQIRELKILVEDKEAPENLRMKAQVTLERLQEASYTIALSEALDVSKASLNITGPLPSDVVKEAIERAKELKASPED